MATSNNNEAALGDSRKRVEDLYGPKNQHSVDFINHVQGRGRAEGLREGPPRGLLEVDRELRSSACLCTELRQPRPP